MFSVSERIHALDPQPQEGSMVYRTRIVDDELVRRLGSMGAVVIEGPKACGKTATARQVAKSEVLLDVECVEERLAFVLVNQGPVTAFQVRVDFQRPLIGVGGDVVVSDQRIFRMLPMLRPGQEIRVFIDTRRELLRRKQSKVVIARVSYHSRTRRWIGERFRHDLRMWADWGEAR